jgi:hypothetical protein
MDTTTPTVRSIATQVVAAKTELAKIDTAATAFEITDYWWKRSRRERPPHPQPPLADRGQALPGRSLTAAAGLLT